MKKQLVARIKLYGKSLFFTTVTVFVLNISSSAQSANTKAPGADKAAVTHVESKETTSMFQVRFPNESGERFSIVIKDAANGSILFNNVYDDKDFDRKFLITDIDKDARLVFTITSLKSKETQTFETNAVSRIIDDVVVTRLK